MKIPQLFVKVGRNKYTPIPQPVKDPPLYFWDDEQKRIAPAKGHLKPHMCEGVLYFVLEDVSLSEA